MILRDSNGVMKADIDDASAHIILTQSTGNGDLGD